MVTGVRRTDREGSIKSFKALGFRVLGFRLRGLGFRAEGLRGLGFRVWGGTCFKLPQWGSIVDKKVFLVMVALVKSLSKLDKYPE